MKAELDALRSELASARATVDALVRGQVDAVVDPEHGPTLLRDAQEALREREQQLRAIFEGALDAMLIADDQGRYLDVNPAASELFGAPCEAMLGKTAADYADPGFDFDAAWRAFLVAERAEGEFHLLRPDGERRILEFRATANILPGRHLSVLRDVTERRQMAERLHAVVSHAPVALFALDRQGVFTLSEGQALQRRSVAPADLLGASLLSQCSGATLTCQDGTIVEPTEVLRRVLDGESIKGTTSAAGATFDIHCGPMRGHGGEVQGLIGVATDVTERSAAEARLAEQRNMLRAIVECAPVAIVVVGSEARVQLWNPAAERLFGWTAAQVLGWPVPIHDDVHALIGAIDHEVVVNRPVQQRHASGQRVEVSMSASPLRDESGHAVGRVAMFADLSEHRRLEEQLRRAHQMESLGRLAAGIAHDFNNMLSVILGFASVARDDLAQADPTREDLVQIVEAAERAGRLTAQLLAFGRRQLMSPATLEVDAIVDDVSRMLRRIIPESVVLRVIRGGSRMRVRVDRAQLEQALVNLVINARDAMPQGGSLCIRTEEIAIDEQEARRRPDLAPGRWVVITVEDTGVGISQDDIERVFEPFFTTKPTGRGTGLGLATVYGIIKQSGGHVEARSIVGEGSTFEVYLPLFEGEATPARPSTMRPATRSGTETVLLVEDEPLVRRLVHQVLRQAGYVVLEASGPAEALVLSQAHAGPIALMLSDVVMPLMSGAELADRLCAQRPEMKLLFMTGYAEAELARHESVPLLSKPFAPRRLLDTVRQIIDG